MKFLPLIWAGLWRKPLRTSLTALSIVAAFVVFGLLQGIHAGFAAIVATQRDDRVWVYPKYFGDLPISYLQQIETIPGLLGIAYDSSFGGSYQDPTERIGVWMTDPDQLLTIYPEIKVAPDQVEALKKMRTGAIIGPMTAKKYGLKIGDRISLHVASVPRMDGSIDWPLDVVGFFDGPHDFLDQGFGRNLIMNYSYFDEARHDNKGRTGWYILRVKNPKDTAKIAQAVDKMFANSSDETHSFPERNDDIGQGNPIGMFSQAIMVAAFVIVLAVTCLTAMQSMRERTPEFGVLKALGFSNTHIRATVIIKSVALNILAACIGLGAAYLLTRFSSVGKFIPGGKPMRSIVVFWGIGAAILVAAVSSFFPTWRAGQLDAAKALTEI